MKLTIWCAKRWQTIWWLSNQFDDVHIVYEFDCNSVNTHNSTRRFDTHTHFTYLTHSHFHFLVQISHKIFIPVYEFDWNQHLNLNVEFWTGLSTDHLKLECVKCVCWNCFNSNYGGWTVKTRLWRSRLVTRDERDKNIIGCWRRHRASSRSRRDERDENIIGCCQWHARHPKPTIFFKN